MKQPPKTDHPEPQPPELHPIDKLNDLIRRLRAPDGCPWDRKQTTVSLVKYLLEEIYEAVDAIQDGDPVEAREELGDSLFQLLMIVELYREQGCFDLADVVEEIHAKMIHRHPHVFGEVRADTAEQVLVNWDRIKRQEKSDRKSLLDGLPKSMPALAKAQKLGDKASRVGFDWQSAAEVVDKVDEERGELARAMDQGDRERTAEELGDLFFALVMLSRHLDINAEQALQAANRKFEDRFRRVEDRFRDAGKDMNQADLEEMDLVWEEVKAEEGRAAAKS